MWILITPEILMVGIYVYTYIFEILLFLKGFEIIEVCKANLKHGYL